MGWWFTYEDGEKQFISLEEGFEMIGELIGKALIGLASLAEDNNE